MRQSLVGRTLLGQYQVVDFISAGGMGAVYKVWDTRRKVFLAMKVLHPQFADDPHIFKRFQREAQALKRLEHPNIVRFFGLFRDGNTTFLLEQFVDGITLRELLRKQGRLSREQVLVVLRGVSAALTYAHQNNVVHCDIKPENVMLDEGGQIYLTDFGIARHADSTTTTMLGIGTAAYMAPEQIREEPVSPATDVYSLAIMAYELLAGRRPFTGEEVQGERNTAARLARLGMAHLKLQPPDPRQFEPNLPPETSQVLLKALAKRPEERYAGVWEFFLALTKSLGVSLERLPERLPGFAPQGGSRPPRRPQMVLHEEDAAADDGVTLLPDDEETPPRKRTPGWVWIAAVVGVLLACVAVGGVLALAVKHDKTTASTSRSGEAAALAPTTNVSGSSRGAENESRIPPTYTPLPTYTPFPTNTPMVVTLEPEGDWRPCPSAPQSRLHSHMHARVTVTPPQPNRVRAAPGLDKPRLGWLLSGEEMEILDGPACADNMVWWKVRSLRSGLVGWTAEGDFDNYWLEPVGD